MVKFPIGNSVLDTTPNTKTFMGYYLWLTYTDMETYRLYSQ